MHDRELLFDLSAAAGPVGYEDGVREVVREALAPDVDRLQTDAMGNVVGTVEGDGDREVVVAAHVDEIGFMVSAVTDDGFLQLDSLGGWNAQILRAQPVTVHTEDGTVPGVIGAEPAHTRDEDDVEGVDDLAVDLGLDGDDAADAVAVGDVISLDATPRVLGDCVTGKALDDRAGVYAMLAAARAADPDATVHFCATVQEEVGLRGARAVATDDRFDPDLVIALDGTLERSVPDVDEAETITTLGDGVGIKRKDASVIPSPTVVDWLTDVAEDETIEHQREVAWNIGTDTGALQNAGGAVLSGALSIPVRYHHSPIETAHREDLTATVDLLAAALERTGELVD
ncbi:MULTISPECIES: M42 family metallopeptidase [Halolamina]|uniref:Endoglucanase n=1 Tax=Halolamina pelagica TaxID=699431 RepID=A0A1I5MEN0_9EURY|nr:MULTISPECIES: M20/M25/M40 family metallo-hydrolase [Halolamina]NHX35991.1 M42 family metallopeptidase [Halolamina sp. R1-12]SFP08054.1 endoglucanase [Halolamina pelagica]